MALKDKYFTVSEAAKELGVSRQTMYRLLTDAKIPTEKVGGVKLVTKKTIRKYKRKRESESFKKTMDAWAITEIKTKLGYTDKDNVERVDNEKEHMVFIATREDGSQEKVLVGGLKLTFQIKAQDEDGPELSDIHLEDISRTESKQPEHKKEGGKKTK